MFEGLPRIHCHRCTKRNVILELEEELELKIAQLAELLPEVQMLVVMLRLMILVLVERRAVRFGQDWVEQ